MTRHTTENSALLMQFRQFAVELVRLREMVEQPGAIPEVDAEARLEAIRDGLAALLRQQATRSQEFGGATGYALYPEAQYVMAALGDEVFLTANWDQRRNWPLLEEELFHSHNSGDRFFRNLDKLLRASSFSTDLAMVYYQALAMDFRGRYRGQAAGKELAGYRQRLYELLYSPDGQARTPEPVFARAYEATVIDEQPRRQPSAQWWWLALVAVLLVWWAGSTVLWEKIARPVRGKAAEVQKIAGARGMP